MLNAVHGLLSSDNGPMRSMLLFLHFIDEVTKA